MDEIYLKTNELNSWIAKYFDKDLISIDELIAVIEDLDSEVEDLRYKLEEKENDYPDEERDREIEILGI